MTQGPQVMIMNNTSNTNTNNSNPNKASRSTGSVETTERCSTDDGTDPAATAAVVVAVATTAAAASSGENPERSPHCSSTSETTTGGGDGAPSSSSVPAAEGTAAAAASESPSTNDMSNNAAATAAAAAESPRNSEVAKSVAVQMPVLLPPPPERPHSLTTRSVSGRSTKSQKSRTSLGSSSPSSVGGDGATTPSANKTRNAATVSAGSGAIIPPWTANNSDKQPQQQHPARSASMVPRIDLTKTATASPVRSTTTAATSAAAAAVPTTTTPDMIATAAENTSSMQGQEQALFEQRICEDPFGIAVRKINQYGKSNLRYVKCLVIDESKLQQQQQQQYQQQGNSSSRSVGMSVSSWVLPTRLKSKLQSQHNGNGTHSHAVHHHHTTTNNTSIYRALAWGKKRSVQIPLDRFTAVRKGKATDRARRCAAPSNRIVSLITVDPSHASLDIEAPTPLDRDKFARAFAKFLNVPLRDFDVATNTTTTTRTTSTSSVGTPSGRPAATATAAAQRSSSASVRTAHTGTSNAVLGALPMTKQQQQPSSSCMTPPPPVQQLPPPPVSSIRSVPAAQDNSTKQQQPPVPRLGAAGAAEGSFYPPPMAPAAAAAATRESLSLSHRDVSSNSGKMIDYSHNSSNAAAREPLPLQETPAEPAVVSLKPPSDGGDGLAHTGEDDDDEDSHMSSLTGHNGYDQELVEELHHALNELRLELEESRAEAARAVKVAEQAIQSAEKSSSAEWQNTVTHKAAEAAAMAQKRSAAALAKQRLAEERLEGERRSASFWRKQAEVAEEEAGSLQTRAAAAEVQRAAAAEQLECERRMAAEQLEFLRSRYTSTDSSQRDALEVAMERNRALDLELDATRRDLQSKQQQDDPANDESVKKKKRSFGRKKKSSSGSDGPDSASLLSSNVMSSSSSAVEATPESVPVLEQGGGGGNTAGSAYSNEQILKVQAETQLMRQQFELLKKATSDHLELLPENARLWGEQVSHTLKSSQSEVARLQAKLAMESASRRKLLHEVQDLRGAVRVYCRPKPCGSAAGGDGLVSLPSQDTLMLHREKFHEGTVPISFEFDRVFDLTALQQDVYTEIEEVCLGVLDGYNICLLCCGPTQCGKTCTLLGDVMVSTAATDDEEAKIEITNYGIQLRAMEQLFTIADLRSDRYRDVFSITIVEVYNERVRDLLVDTETGASRGEIVVVDAKSTGKDRRKSQKVAPPEQAVDDESSGRRATKLEIRTDIHGNTVVQGLISVEVDSFADVSRIWEEALETKTRRLDEQGMDARQYESACHVIATLTVNSSNIATGINTVGRIQFADLASADIVPRRTTPDADPNSVISQSEYRFANRSLETLSECVEARIQFDRSVPYRNSTLTHLLRDSLEADTKVLMIACVSSDPKDLQETIATLKFATRMRRVTIGKATKHTLSPP